MKKVYFSMLAIFVVFGVLFALGCNSKDPGTPGDAVTAFMEAVDAEDSEKIVELAGEDAADISRYGAGVFDKMTGYTIGTVNNISETEATVVVKIAAEDAETFNKIDVDFTFPVNLVEGKWQIDIDNLDADWDNLSMIFHDDDDLNSEEETEEEETEEEPDDE